MSLSLAIQIVVVRVLKFGVIAAVVRKVFLSIAGEFHENTARTRSNALDEPGQSSLVLIVVIMSVAPVIDPGRTAL